MSRGFDRFKAWSFLVVMAGYILFNYAFMQLRIPPVGMGLPVGELLLIVVLLSIDAPTVLSRMGATVFLFPFLVWWGWGFTRFVFDLVHEGIWTIRDASQLIESLFLIAGFALAGQVGMATRLLDWLRPVIAIACLYNLLFSYGDDIAAISPTLSGGSDQGVAIFGSFATTGTLMLWGAAFCIIGSGRRPAVRIRNGIIAGLLVAFTLLVVQARTTYMQLLGLAALMLLVRPRALGRLGLAVPVMFAALVVISAFDLRISGRLTSHVSLSFFWDHIQSTMGIGADGHGGVAAAAEGVDLRLGWWTRIYDQMTSDAVKLITGLGFGIPLTNFSDTLGVVTREPHNSVISVTARLGLIGIVAWIWMQIELFRVGFRAYRGCRRRGWSEEANLLLVILAFAVLAVTSCLAEDVMEKPYNAIPYYAFWGFALRIAYRLRVEAARDVALQGESPSFAIVHPNVS